MNSELRSEILVIRSTLFTMGTFEAACSFINFCIVETVAGFFVGVCFGVPRSEPATEPDRDPARDVAFDLKVFTFLNEFMPERW